MESMCFQFSCVFHLSTFICHDPRLASREHLLLHPDILWGNTWKKTVSFPGKLKAIDIGHAFFYGRFRISGVPHQADTEGPRGGQHAAKPLTRFGASMARGGGCSTVDYRRRFQHVLICLDHDPNYIYIYIIILYIYVYPLVI